MARSPERRRRRDLTFLLTFALADGVGVRHYQRRDPRRSTGRARADYDRAVVEYTKALRADPDDHNARLALDRAKMRASQEHYFRGRRLAATERHEEAPSSSSSPPS